MSSLIHYLQEILSWLLDALLWVPHKFMR